MRMEGQFAELKALADKDDAAAQAEVGRRLANGIQGAPYNSIAAMQYLTVSAKQGNPDGIFGVAFQYLIGQGVPKNAAEYMRLLRQAADLGNPQALSGLAIYYSHPPEEDFRKVIELLERAAKYHGSEPGIDNVAAAGAAANLGYYYMAGDKIEQDKVAALKWFTIANARGKDLYVEKTEALEQEVGPNAATKAKAEAKRWLIASGVPTSSPEPFIRLSKLCAPNSTIKLRKDVSDQLDAALKKRTCADYIASQAKASGQN